MKFEKLLELYKKIKTNQATIKEKIDFNVGLSMYSFEKDFVIKKLEEATQEKENQ